MSKSMKAFPIQLKFQKTIINILTVLRLFCTKKKNIIIPNNISLRPSF